MPTRFISAQALRRVSGVLWIAATTGPLFGLKIASIDRTLRAGAVTATVLAGLRERDAAEAEMLRMAFWAGTLHRPGSGEAR